MRGSLECPRVYSPPFCLHQLLQILESWNYKVIKGVLEGSLEEDLCQPEWCGKASTGRFPRKTALAGRGGGHLVGLSIEVGEGEARLQVEGRLAGLDRGEHSCRRLELDSLAFATDLHPEGNC